MPVDAFRIKHWLLVAVSVGSCAFSCEVRAVSELKGDFNGDEHDDLAVGSPSGVGAVNIIYGSPSFLTATGNQAWQQGVNGLVGLGEIGDSFGWALAAGNFDGNEYTDLAIGVPFGARRCRPPSSTPFAWPIRMSGHLRWL